MFARRTDGLEISGLRKVFEKASSGAINLGLGEPDFQPPEHVVAALGKAVRDGNNKYGPIGGIPALREAIARRLQRYDPDMKAENVLVTIGGSEALFASALAFYETGDRVLVPDPGFVFYAPHARLFGAEPVPYALESKNEFIPSLEEVETLAAGGAKAIVVNTPSNPTGGAFPLKVVEGICDIARRTGAVVIADEVYDDMVYDGAHNSFLGRAEKAVYIGSFSKSYAMTGWRLGYLAASDREIAERLMKIHYHIVACPPSPFQHAALAALEGPQDFTKRMTEEFRRRRDAMVPLLNAVPGFTCPMPRGAFYAFPSFTKGCTSMSLAMKLLENGVICSPGSAFGKRGEGHLRFSYSASLDNIKKGLEVVRTTLEGAV